MTGLRKRRPLHPAEARRNDHALNAWHAPQRDRVKQPWKHTDRKAKA